MCAVASAGSQRLPRPISTPLPGSQSIAGRRGRRRPGPTVPAVRPRRRGILGDGVRVGYALFQVTTADPRRLGRTGSAPRRSGGHRAPRIPTEFFGFIGCDRSSITRRTGPSAASGTDSSHSMPVARRGAIRELSDDFIRENTPRLKFSEAMTHLGKVLSDPKATVELSVDIRLLVLEPEPGLGVECHQELRLGPSASRALSRQRRRQAVMPGGGLTTEHLDVQELGISVRARRAA